MCRYRYRQSYCAHRQIEERECVGEDNCLVRSSPMRYCQMNSHCSSEQWHGLYCAKYQRFYCSGIENCGTAESYMTHFARFREFVERRT
ncbi:MAG: hypothetical protein ABSB83_01635 [Methanomassiliicoccales archaeon]